MSRLTPNYPPLVGNNCNCNNSSDCVEIVELGNIFSDDALYKLEKSDDICDAYDKINRNMKMLADGFLLLAQALQTKDEVYFGSPIPISFQGTFFFDTVNQKMYVWNVGKDCYVPVYGENSTNPTGETVGEPHVPNNEIPTLQNLRNISDGVDVNHFKNCYVAQQVTFVNTTPTCSVSLFIYDKSDGNLKIWSPENKMYIPAFGCNSQMSPHTPLVTSNGAVTEKIEL